MTSESAKRIRERSDVISDTAGILETLSTVVILGVAKKLANISFNFDLISVSR